MQRLASIRGLLRVPTLSHVVDLRLHRADSFPMMPLALRLRNAWNSSDGIATAMPVAVQISASEIPAARVLGSPLPWRPGQPTASWANPLCASADFFCVPNVETAAALRQAGIPDGRIKIFGFPVNPIFVEGPCVPLPSPAEHTHRKILYLINTRKKKAGKAINRLLEIPDVHLTITVGRDAELKEKLIKRTGWAAEM